MGNRVQYELDKEPSPAHVVVLVGFRISAIGAFLKGNQAAALRQ